ncbi:MAG TPA: hypothetical protein VFO31_02515 [Vicinamibacterales bacterium]|nr:hypothetical protein [Vicinamibacterales bacterium]
MTKRALTAPLFALALAGAAAPALAQRNPQQPVPDRPPVLVERGRPLSDSERAAFDAQNAYNTQQDLWRVMRQYPPAVGEIIQRDPSLLGKLDYMSAYPALAAFVEQHPEISRNPGFYFGTYQYRERSSTDRAYNMMEDILGGMAVGTGLIGLASVFIWLVKTIVDHRRWLRTSKVQVEMHTKLLDRLTTNEDLMAYAQSPAGSRFLESTPISLEAESRASAPVGRIIWSMQAGIVLMALGGGLLWVQKDAIEEVRQGISVIQAIVGSVGVGLIVSAVAAYVVSGRLGILPSKKVEESAK